MTVFEKAKMGGAVPCTEADYEYALGVVPPKEYLPNGFVMGEQYDACRWYCFWQFEGQYWCMLTMPSDYRAVSYIGNSGIIYDMAMCQVR